MDKFLAEGTQQKVASLLILDNIHLCDDDACFADSLALLQRFLTASKKVETDFGPVRASTVGILLVADDETCGTDGDKKFHAMWTNISDASNAAKTALFTRLTPQYAFLC